MENRYKVLIADDDAHISELIALYMEKEGYETLEAHTGREAIESFKEHDPDIVLLDIMMPEKNGYEVLSIIRNKKIDIPILLLSALNEVNDKVQGFDLGANDYLSKPFSTKELIARIKVMLKENIVDDSYLQYQDILLNKKEETLSCKNIKYQLSKYECSILSLLIRSELNRVPVWLVIEKVWQNKVDVDVKTVSLYISYVNRKLKASASKAYIKFDEENIELCVNI